MSTSNFFLPLTGKEDKERLEGKYKSLLDSEDDDEEDISSNRRKGKISHWTLDESTTTDPNTSPWLHSPSKKNSLNRVKKSYDSQKTKNRRVQSAKPGSSTNNKSGESASTSSGPRSSSDSNRCDGGKGSKQEQRRHHTDDNDDEIEDDDCESEDERKKQSRKRNDRLFDKGEDERGLKFDFEKGGEGFSTVDTERPKLSVHPVAAKVDFQLSQDGEEPVVKVPACINQYLRDYQRDGIRFLYQHYIQDKGAILGDDMGLGKTIQVIGFLSALLGKKGDHRDAIRALPKFIRQLSGEETDSPPRTATKPFLIVGPSAVLFNWLEELITWGYFCTGKFHGVDKENCLSDVKKGKLEIVVTTFETFRDNVDRLCEIEWEAVIVDEVHKIKGLKAQISKALGMVSTRCRYGLTGTALQNNLIELWSLLDWAQPGILGSPEKFFNEFIQVMEIGQRHDASKRDLALARKQRDKFAVIRKQILLRRTKALIADQLPSKEDMVVMCRLTDFQVSIYKAILNHPRMALILHAEDPCDCGRKKMKASCCFKRSEDGIKTWSLVLSYMHLLLKAANHCALLIPVGTTSKLQHQHIKEVCEQVLKDFPQFVEQTRDAAFLTLSDPKYCGKMKIVQGLLSVFSSARDKVLVFSYSTRLLDIIEQYIISQCYEFRRIDGKTSSQKRMDIVHQFNKDPDIFLCLISTKAGGLGLNLTGANRVVIFDPNWNPSHDLQAQDRAYRIGQTRDVKVYRLVSAGTIEENIYLRQIYKQVEMHGDATPTQGSEETVYRRLQLDEVAIGTSNAKRYFHGIQGDRFTKGELFGVKNMFTLRTSDTCLTMDILKRNEKLEKDLAGYDITRYIPPSLGSESVDSNDDGDNDVYESKEDRGEEDDIFLQAMFGKGKDRTMDEGIRSPLSPSKIHSKYKDIASSSTSQRNYGNNSSRSSNDDDEDFFLPKLHSRSIHERNQNSLEGKTSERDLFTVDEITFTKSNFNTVQTQQNADSLDKRRNILNHERPPSGISWLFPDSGSEEEGDNKEDGDRDGNGFGSRRNEKEFLKHGKSPSSLSWLFPDSSDDISDNDEASRYEERIRKAEKESRKSKNIADRAIISEGSKPSTSGVKQTKAGTKTKSRQSGASTSNFDAVRSVFEDCGVLHVHGNKEVIGSSRAEDHMTRCAMQEVFEMETNSQLPALQCDPLPQPEENEEEPKSKKRKGKKELPDHNTATSTKVGSVKILLGQTPPGVQRLVWDELCKFVGEDQLVLAQRIASCGAEERLEILHKFYTHKHSNLADTLTVMLRINSPDEPDTSNVGQKGKQLCKKSNSTTLRRGSTSEQGQLKRNVKTTIAKRTPSKSKGKQRRPPASTLTGHTFMDSESQDSLTALSPPRDASSQDNDSERYSPVPPKRKQRILTPKGSKSSATTRVREKAMNKFARDKLFQKPQGRKGVTYCDKEDKLQHDSLVSPSYESVQIPETLDSHMKRGIEDIPSLLCEMESKTSVGSKYLLSTSHSSKHNINENSKIVTRSSDLFDTVTEVYDVSAKPCTSYQIKVSDDSYKDKQYSKGRNYASVLDDLFDKTLDVDTGGFVKEILSEKSDRITEKVNDQDCQSPRKKLRIIECGEKSNPACTIGLDHSDKNSSPCKDGASIAILDDSDNYDEVDCLFLGSTLKEDSPKSSRRRKHHSSPVKESRKKRLFSIKMDKEDVLDEAGNSQSLFS